MQKSIYVDIYGDGMCNSTYVNGRSLYNNQYHFKNVS